MLEEHVASVLKTHQKTSGMAVTMGWTCACGYWASGCKGDTYIDHQAKSIVLHMRRGIFDASFSEAQV